MTTPNSTFEVRDEATIQAAWLRTYQNGFVQYGLLAPNILPGSEAFIRARAFARQLTVTESNAVVSVNNQMPDSAQGDYLTRWLALFGLSVRGLGGSAGNITLNNSQITVVAVNAPLTDPSGNLYAVAVGGTYAVAAPVPVISLTGGTATNLVNGTLLKWLVPPAYCGQTCQVGIPGGEDGLVGGVDAENPENARARMILRLQNPMGGGNWTTFALLAAASTPTVQAGFVYPAANGPGTVHVAVVGYASTLAASNARNRDVSAAVMNSTVIPYITGNATEYVECVVTTVVNQPVDCAISLALPSAPAASPPGPGGGWLDSIPWPNNSTNINPSPPYSSGFTCTATSIQTSTQFTCNALTPPIPGVSRIAWLDPSTWQLNTATVVAYTGTTGAYIVEFDTPWPNLISSFTTYGNLAYIFPQSVNQQLYVTSFLNAMGAMGPGEKTNAAGLISRALRKPFPTVQFPYSMGYSQLNAITDSDPNIASSNWYYLSAVTPTLPASISLPPNCFVPRNFGLYPAVVA